MSRSARPAEDVVQETARSAGFIALGAGLAAAAVGTAVIGGFVAAVARAVVTPDRKRNERVPIHAVDPVRKTVTIERTADTELQGRYSLWFGGGTGHMRVGEVLGTTDTTVTRRIIAIDAGDPTAARRGRWGGWFYLTPGELDVPVEDVDIPTPNGPAPAWVVRADDPAAPWAVLVHGRGVTRAETIRAVPVFRAAGYSVVLASWRNDGVAPPSVDGRYGLGSTEWEDVDSVLRWLTAQDAQSVVLMGWSMGGAVVLQTLLRSRFAGLVDGVVLESPVVDWHAVLKSQSQLLRLPRPVRKVAQRLLRTPVLYRLAGLQAPVDLRELDMVTRSDELTVPILLLHSDDDGFVPSSASHDLARARPDLVRLEIQTTARHTKLWNHDADWFDARILAWLTEVVQRRGAASAR
ncbi:lysophospholipase [Curtobacterium flaccumfaciens pv. flaccumfaciens]|jgi:alpha-beta hydrolase superfamily lysophospholipase|uniref:alpha/beta fold hydrolase n=2 Tax=Microbacteriaceae TaxID=85023 RepID=UPI000DA7BD26|nr:MULTISPECIES: alpha/beta fold hydrolase [Curtobacterium]MCS6570046.1 lysophospholipase [Curtobacterium flaccumfaciens pv. flaccumfaciens]MCS6583354.1 lysophospholipase [Curtobacterium flaccumfaciens pv. flaccumfaciens]WIE80670.1 alpha/beta fold hydrolase [Curtobacterium sp. MCSS17_016]WIE84881.1 alpha/beta fold hydrolase [Curtobacterium sp. MCPF17_021]